MRLLLVVVLEGDSQVAYWRHDSELWHEGGQRPGVEHGRAVTLLYIPPTKHLQHRTDDTVYSTSATVSVRSSVLVWSSSGPRWAGHCDPSSLKQGVLNS